MNRIILVLFGIVIFSCNFKNTDTTEKLPGINKTNEFTEFKFNEDIHNFGMLQSGETVIFQFVFTNTGKNNLAIENVESDCGCIRAKFPKQPILPDKTGIIEIEFNTSGMFGKEFKTIEVHANTKNQNK